ncbi:hypothetical protein [Rhizorhapis sp. SPR117]|uniref:hypothetical protein n=1 Tax=Rhizorhapis sp. SPR117 TaxID=2912611 RepID=UPI001F466311|nr:hypothetical protein [Rhizorhapis sp. SPR117]
MVEPRTFASLTSGLLARKGNATPAMRRQSIGGMGNIALGHEDLGWNDMGEEASHASAYQPFAGLSPMPGTQVTPPAPPPVALVPVETATEEDSDEQIDTAPAPAIPAVVEQRKLLAEKVTNGEIEDETPAPAPRKVHNVKSIAGSAALKQRKAKAAFTLRLDPERHLKLRLACAITNRSAQQLVIEALDDLMTQLPQLDQLADQVPGARAAKIAGGMKP